MPLPSMLTISPVSARALTELRYTAALAAEGLDVICAHDLKRPGQENGWRSGTENVFGVKTLEYAAEKKFSSLAADYERLASYRESLWSALDPGIFARLSPKDGTPYILTVSARGLRGEILLHLAGDRGLIGTGSACSSNEKSRYSHVVLACGYDKITADGVLRLSFSPATTKEETERAAQILNACARELLERTK